MAASSEGLMKKDIPLNGKLITSDDGVLAGAGFTTLQNLRYTDAHPKGVQGMSKINTTPLANPHIRSAFHFEKDQPTESHILVQAYDSNGANPKVYRNDTAVPSAGDFSGTVLHTDASGAGTGHFSSAPNGSVVYCNGAESLIWGGDEMRLGAWINYDPGGAFKYDFSSVLQNNLSDTVNIATLHTSASGGIDSNTKLMLHLDNDVTDSESVAKTVTNNAVTFSNSTYKFGYSGVFDGSTSYLSTPDHADFDFSGGNWTIDSWVRSADMSADQCLYSQRTDASNWVRFYVDTTGAIFLKVKVAGVESTIIGAASSTIAVNNWYHIEVSQSGTTYRIFVNGTIAAQNTSATSLANYTQTVYIGAHHDNVSPTDFFNGYLDEFRVSNTARHTSNFEVASAPYSTGGSGVPVYNYVGSSRPITGMKLYMKTANAASGTITLEYWDGSSWVSVGSLVDNTSGMTVTGTITFSDTSTVAEQSVRDSLVLYWYRLTLSASTNTALYYVTLKDVMQPMVDVWDGIERKITSFQKNTGSYVDYTNAVYDDTFSTADASTYCNVGGLTAGSQDFAIGFSDQVSAVHIYFGGGYVNTTASTVCSVSYWNGAAWTSVGAIIDGTSANGISLANTGIISWNSPSASLEFRRSLNQQNDIQLYFYKFSFSQNLSADVRINYATGIPAPSEIHPYKFSLSAMNRVFLCSDQAGRKNSVRYSADSTSDVYNGSDSSEIQFGDDKEVTAACWLYSQYGTSLYNTIVFTKQSETHILVGNGPKDWAKYQVSPTIGCPAPKTMVVLSAPLEMYGGSNRTVAIWQGTEGIYMFDGKGFTPIHLDIQDFWDSRNSYAINRSVIASNEGFYDTKLQEYHWLFASGNSTTINKEFVYDIRRKKWFEIVRGAGKILQHGIEVSDSSGNTYCYGFIDTGYMERLETGKTFDGSSIAHSMIFGDMPLDDTWRSTKIRAVELIALSKSATGKTVTLTHWSDTSSTSQTLSMSLTKTGYRVSFPILSEQCQSMGDAIFHRFGFSVSTNDEDTGFEPIQMSIKFLKGHDAR